MLRGIHKASSTWLGKALMATVMGFIVISFVIWGIGDIFRGFGRNAALKIGATEISLEQLREYYSDQLRQLSRRTGRTITPDQARALGIDRQLLGRLVAETTLDEQAKALRLGVSNAEVASRITGDPAFRGPTGTFNRARFEELIREAGYTEGRFVEEQRRVLLRRQIAQSIAGELHVPTVAIAAINQYQNEQRTIEYLALTAAQAGDIATPAADVLETYFEDHKVQFRAPEYRKVTLLSLSPADIAKPDAVPDADAKAYYEQHKANYGTPEKRELRQIVYPNAEDAKAARERAAKGASFDDLVKERGLRPSDTDVGMVAKSDVIDPAIADAAFTIKPGVVSEPVTGQFGTVLLQVGKIEPGSQKSYEDVAADIKRSIAETQARTQVGTLRDKIEDERAAGSTLTEAGKKFGVKVRVIDALDRSGRGADGKPIADLPGNLVAAVFNTDIGVDNETLQLPNGGYLYYDVTGITPSRERTLAEVKDQVEKRWRDDAVAKRLTAKTDDMLGKLKAGSKLGELASAAGLKVETAKALQRGKPTDKLPPRLIMAVFRTAKDAVGNAEGNVETERYVFRVTAVVDPKLDPPSAETKALSATLLNSYSDDITSEYVTRLENEFGVTVNQAAVTQIIGGGSNQ